MKKRSLGIDLGGCMSGNTAFALIEWDDRDANVIELFKEPKHKDAQPCFEFLKEVLHTYPVDAIAVDAPFSLPRMLIEPGFKAHPREASGEIANPYLYRYTDYWLYKNYGLRPMPPAGDRIGRLTARMVELLHACDYQAPYIRLHQTSTPIYEVYPKQIAFSMGYTKYKDKQEKILQEFSLQDIDDEHLLDAVLCSFCATKILEKKTVFPPPEAKNEGWCYPLLDSNF
jgi:predicted nuclease with RNAse H fold